MPVSSATTLIVFNSAAQLERLMYDRQIEFTECDALLLDCAEQVDESVAHWLSKQFGTTFLLSSSATTNKGNFTKIDYDEWARLSIQYAHTAFWPLA